MSKFKIQPEGAFEFKTIKASVKGFHENDCSTNVPDLTENIYREKLLS